MELGNLHQLEVPFEIKLARNNTKLTIDRFGLISVHRRLQKHKKCPYLKRKNYLLKIDHLMDHLTHAELSEKFIHTGFHRFKKFGQFLKMTQKPRKFKETSEKNPKQFLGSMAPQSSGCLTSVLHARWLSKSDTI